jgi:hypothetical protein
MSISVDDLLDVEAAAAHVGCSTYTIRYRMKCGLVPSVVLGQSKYFIAADLDAHFQEKPLIDNHERRYRVI